MRSRYLVCYDIAHPKRLGRVFRYLKMRGVHLQYSVFLCSLTWPELQGLKAELARRIDPEEDDVRIYPLPSEGKVTALGLAARIPTGVEMFFSDGSSEHHRKVAQLPQQDAENSNEREGVLKEH
jgi:CRISPR-associated protein Cas2